jgi:hypothetical protein
MSDDFGLLNLIVSPVLERIVREERLAGDQPRRTKLLKPRKAHEEPDSTPSEDTQQTDDSASSKHIDLRI